MKENKEYFPLKRNYYSPNSFINKDTYIKS